MSEHTPLTEAERELLSSLCDNEATRGAGEDGYCYKHYAPVKWAGHANAHEVCCVSVEDYVEQVLAARTSTATADTGHQSGCQEFPTGWLCVSDCTTVWHDKDADTGLRERVEALLDERNHWIGEAKRYERLYRSRDEDATRWFQQRNEARAALDATAAPTTDTGARDE